MSPSRRWLGAVDSGWGVEWVESRIRQWCKPPALYVILIPNEDGFRAIAIVSAAHESLRTSRHGSVPCPVHRHSRVDCHFLAILIHGHKPFKAGSRCRCSPLEDYFFPTLHQGARSNQKCCHGTCMGPDVQTRSSNNMHACMSLLYRRCSTEQSNTCEVKSNIQTSIILSLFGIPFCPCLRHWQLENK
jgi:hypothetical protein